MERRDSSEEKPPKISFKLENAGDVPYFTKTWSDDDLPIDILLLAVESCDFLSCFSLQDQLLKIYKSEFGYIMCTLETWEMPRTKKR